MSDLNRGTTPPLPNFEGTQHAVLQRKKAGSVQEVQALVKTTTESPEQNTIDNNRESTESAPVLAMKLKDGDERLAKLGATPTAALSKVLKDMTGDAVELNEWLEDVLGEDTASDIITTSNDSKNRMSQTIGSLKRRGYLNVTFFDALIKMYSSRSSDIIPVQELTLNRYPQWRPKLNELLMSLFTDSSFPGNKSLDHFLAAHFEWEKEVLNSIITASRPDMSSYSFDVSGALERRGYLDQPSFYQKAYASSTEYWQPVVLHIWWMQQEKRKRGR